MQRYWMGENVGLLPFTDEKLAASVGKTAAEMNAMPINPLAADVVFDALSTSNAGILARSVCDEQRASFRTLTAASMSASFQMISSAVS